MFKHSGPARRHRWIVVLVVVASLATASCSAGRPAVGEWQPTWERISSGIPIEATVGEDPSPTVCASALVFIRSNREELFPTPDLAIDDTVTDWVEIAEDAFFECPPNNEQIGSFSEAIEELARLQAEIEVVL